MTGTLLPGVWLTVQYRFPDWLVVLPADKADGRTLECWPHPYLPFGAMYGAVKLGRETMLVFSRVTSSKPVKILNTTYI